MSQSPNYLTDEELSHARDLLSRVERIFASRVVDRMTCDVH